jgi:hypothetical protein
MVGVTKTQGTYFGYISISAATVMLYIEADLETIPRNPKNGARRAERARSAPRPTGTPPANAPASGPDTNTATSNGRNFRSRVPCRHHPCHKLPDDLRLMLAGGAFQRIRALERTRARNLHLPSVIRLRPDDRNPPIPRPIRQRVFNDGPNFRPHHRHAARVMHLHRNCHTSENITTSSAAANAAANRAPRVH